MRVKYKNKTRIRCDVCGKLIPPKEKGRVLFDAVISSKKDVCTPKCADKYFHDNYQLPLIGPNPYGNTGVKNTNQGEI